MRFLFILFIFMAVQFNLLYAQNNRPSIVDLFVVADTTNKELSITYRLFEAESELVEISLQISDNKGKSYAVNTTNAMGDIGFPIEPNKDFYEIVVPYESSLDLREVIVKLVADDQQEVDIQTLVNKVDSNRLISDMQLVEGERHRFGETNHLEEVKALIEIRFEEAGLYASRQAFEYGAYTAHNVIGQKHGVKAEEKIWIIDGHFDSVQNTPGADDNASAVVGLLEALRVLKNYEFDHSIKFIGFDLEEDGLVGARYFVEEGGIAEDENIMGVLNLEMIGYYSEVPNSQEIPFGFEILYPDEYEILEENEFRGDFLINVANYNSSGLMELLDSCAAVYVPDLKVISLALPGNSEVAPDFRRSDHAVFWDADYQALMLTDGANFRNKNYHTNKDTKETLNYTFMHNIVKTSVATLAEAAGIKHSGMAKAAVVTDLTTYVGQLLHHCQFQVAPNPSANGQLYFSFGKCADISVDLTIFDNNGKKMYQTKINPAKEREQAISTANWPKGLYFIQVKKEGHQVVQKVLVQ